MAPTWFMAVGFLLIVFQASASETTEEANCVPGFKSDVLIFRVTRKHLGPGTRLGRDLRNHKRAWVKRMVTLLEGHQDFFIHSWNLHGQKMTVPVTVVHYRHLHGQNDGHHHGHHQQNVEHHLGEHRHHNNQHHLNEVDSANVTEILSSEDKVKTIYYSITGPGADEPPYGLFTMDRITGYLYVTESLDREKQDRYTFQAHAAVEGSRNAEEPMDIIVNVIDQNDNKPAFVQDTFLVEVPESSPTGFEVITVLATDMDEPGNSNSIVRYSILSLDPDFPSGPVFAINPITGAIRVNAHGLDREKHPKHILVIEAADMDGEGLTVTARVIITVSDSNDNPPAFTQSTYEATVPENRVGALVVTMVVTDRDEPHSPAWNAKFKIVDGDPGGLFTVTTGSKQQEGIITTAKKRASCLI
ncbi:cadherin-2-like [Limanda limanda]|uniref:cadherin-2-like n=1 Tax=Limanda limanda TaxID=27771 RepID=UPI0029C81E37|nr:cadherin-2-like [Limanda limanda]